MERTEPKKEDQITAKPKQKSQIEALKVEGQIIFVQKNDEGQVILEKAIGMAQIYSPDFPATLRGEIEAQWPQIEEAFGVSRNGAE